MFGMFKKESDGHKAMKDLMLQIQSNLESDGLGQEMRFYQKGLFSGFHTFKEYSASYKDEGMTEVGGLAKFCLNALNQTVNPIQDGRLPIPLVVDLAEKLCYVVKALPNTVDGLNGDVAITGEDLKMMHDADRVANQWLACDQRMKLLEEVEFKLTTISEKYGVAGTAVNPKEVVGIMQQW